MFANNNIISNRQLRRLIIIELFSGSSILLPYLGTTYGGKDGIIALLMAAVGVILYGWAMLYLSTVFRLGFISELQNRTGEIFSAIILGLYIGRFFIRAALLLNIFSVMVGTTMLTKYSNLAIIVPMIIVCGYGASRKMENRARLIELIYWIVLIPIIILMIMAVKEVSISYTIPNFTNSIMENLKADYIMMMVFLPIEFVLFIMPYVRKNHNRVKHGVASIVIVMILNILLYVIVVGILGVNGAKDNMLSTLNIMQAVEIPFGILERFDIFMIIFWLIGLFSIISGYIFYSTYILDRILPSVNRYILLVCVMIIIVAITMLCGNAEQMLNKYIRFYMYFDMPTSIIIPLILFIFSRRRRNEKSVNA